MSRPVPTPVWSWRTVLRFARL